MKTSKHTFNAEEIIDKLRPYVSEVKEMNILGYEHTYTGLPLFQITNNIHILRWGSPEFFHTNTKSVDEAIPIINEAILFLKSIIEKTNEDFK